MNDEDDDEDREGEDLKLLNNAFVRDITPIVGVLLSDPTADLFHEVTKDN